MSGSAPHRPGAPSAWQPLAWLFAAVLLTVWAHLRWIDAPFSWGGAQSALMARSFLDLGVVGLKGIPIDNHPPFGIEPEYYLHWPPLYPILLSWLFRGFGETEAVARALQLGLVLGHALVLAALGRAISGDRRVGLFAAFAWLVIPVSAEFGYIVWPLQIILLATSVVLLAFVRASAHDPIRGGWALAGCFAMVVGVLSSWEPLMLLPGLLAVCFWKGRRTHRRLAMAFAGVGTLTAFLLLAHYAIQVPAMVADLWDALMYRTGFSDAGARLTSTNQLLYSRYPQLPLGPRFAGIGERLVVQVGPIAVAAIAWALWWAWRTRSETGPIARWVVLGGWLSLPLCWTLVLSNHMLHRYQHAVFAPLGALALGLAFAQAYDRIARASPRVRWLGLVVVGVLLPGLLFGIGARAARERAGHGEPGWVMAYAKAVESATPPDSAIVSPHESMTPIYYSRRHTVRAVGNDAALAAVLPSLESNFPCTTLYLALSPGRTGGFERSVRRLTVVQRSEDLLLLRLKGAWGCPLRE